MINKIISIIFALITFVISIIINLVLLAFPAFDLAGLTPFITTFYQIVNQGINFVYFIVGDNSTPILIDIVVILIGIKHLAIPIANLIRKFFIK